MEKSIELFGTFLFALAIIHTFAARQFQVWANRFPEGHFLENLLHLLGEVEVVFGLWAGVLVLYMFAVLGEEPVVQFLNSLNFTEPLFVFVIMSVCSTQPILDFAVRVIDGIANVLPLSPMVAFYAVALVVGPLLGSLITEPAAMTVTALLLLERVFLAKSSLRLKYATLGSYL